MTKKDEPKQAAPPSEAPEGHYKKYDRWVLKVETFTRSVPGAGKIFDRHEMRFVEVCQDKGIANTNITIEPFRAQRLNVFANNSLHWLLEQGAKQPKRIIRKMREDGNGEINGGYEDTFIYE